MKSLLLLYFSLSLIEQAISLTASCGGSCICGSFKVTCRDGLTEIPSQITGKSLSSIKQFFCVFCQIPTLKANSFANYSILEEVTIHFSSLSGIESGAFSGLETRLVSLDLSDNSFTKISSHFFTGLTELESLDMQTNQIAEIEQGSFDGLTSLSAIFFQNNQIAFLPDYLFSSTVLTQFDLTENSLNLLSSLPFPLNGPSFSFIHFTNNNLVKIHPNMTSLFINAGLVRLDGNLLVCDCFVSGLQSAIQSQATKFSDSTNPARCGYPNSFLNMKLSDITIDASGCEAVCQGVLCSSSAVCSSVSDWPVCSCNPGFQGNGHICTDPCADSGCVGLATCSYDPVSMNASCVCPVNYQLDGTGKNCVELTGCALDWLRAFRDAPYLIIN